MHKAFRMINVKELACWEQPGEDGIILKKDLKEIEWVWPEFI